MGYRKVSGEVYYSDESLVTMSARDIAFLKETAAGNPRRRVRLCAHAGLEDKVHEMFIVHYKDAYVRPHKHLDRGESFQVLEGEADVVLYNDDGSEGRVIEMGDMASGKVFFYRFSDAFYHTLRIRSEILLFKEVTSGPFNRNGAVFAPWSPEESDAAGVREFMRVLQKGGQ